MFKVALAELISTKEKHLSDLHIICNVYDIMYLIHTYTENCLFIYIMLL